MTATLQDLQRWYNDGKKMKGVTHVIVVCDTYDHDNYPKYAKGPEDLQTQLSKIDGRNMQRLEEVYDLSIPFDTSSRRRVMQLPPGVHA